MRQWLGIGWAPWGGGFTSPPSNASLPPPPSSPFVKVEILGHIRPGDLPDAVQVVKRHNGVMVTTLVVEALRHEARALAEVHSVPCVDLFAGLIECFTQALGTQPSEEFHSYKRCDAMYAQFCRAVQYALAHDDGAHPEGWCHADAILLGVSAAGKSPLSIFMATFGLRVANWPLCPGVDLPEELLKIDKQVCRAGLRVPRRLCLVDGQFIAPGTAHHTHHHYHILCVCV